MIGLAQPTTGVCIMREGRPIHVKQEAGVIVWLIYQTLGFKLTSEPRLKSSKWRLKADLTFPNGLKAILLATATMADNLKRIKSLERSR